MNASPKSCRQLFDDLIASTYRLRHMIIEENYPLNDIMMIAESSDIKREENLKKYIKDMRVFIHRVFAIKKFRIYIKS